jgi:hypothetical protein
MALRTRECLPLTEDLAAAGLAALEALQRAGPLVMNLLKQLGIVLASPLIDSRALNVVKFLS